MAEGRQKPQRLIKKEKKQKLENLLRARRLGGRIRKGEIMQRERGLPGRNSIEPSPTLTGKPDGFPKTGRYYQPCRGGMREGDGEHRGACCSKDAKKKRGSKKSQEGFHF